MSAKWQNYSEEILRLSESILELAGEVVVAKFATTTQHGAMTGKSQTHDVSFYNLDVIISVGYRVKSKNGVEFRRWANRVLKDYLINRNN